MVLGHMLIRYHQCPYILNAMLLFLFLILITHHGCLQPILILCIPQMTMSRHPSYYPPRRMQIEHVSPLPVLEAPMPSNGYSKARHNRHSPASPSPDSSSVYHSQRSDSHNKRKSNRRTSTSSSRHSSHVPTSLADYEGSILDLALQQKGCRMLQRELDLKGVSMVDVIYRAIGDQINLLVMDQYGNYLFQKLIDLSNDDQKREVVGSCRCISVLVTACSDAIGCCIKERSGNTMCSKSHRCRSHCSFFIHRTASSRI